MDSENNLATGARRLACGASRLNLIRSHASCRPQDSPYKTNLVHGDARRLGDGGFPRWSRLCPSLYCLDCWLA